MNNLWIPIVMLALSISLLIFSIKNISKRRTIPAIGLMVPILFWN